MKAGETSKGKTRPRHPRASDLRVVDPAGTPSAERGPDGRFARGNTVGRENRFVHTMLANAGRGHEGEALILAKDTRRVLGQLLQSLPSSAPPVRVLATISARHTVMNGYFVAKAEAAGLDTERGQALLAIASRESQRAERTLISAMDVARVCAEQERRKRGPINPLADLLPKGTQ